MSSYKAYGERYAKAYAQGLAALNPHALDPELLRVVLQCSSPAPRLLELGCGEGFDARGLAELGYDVTALDCSPHALARARELNGHPNVLYQEFDVVCGDLAATWGTFDVVYSIGCFHVLDCDDDRLAWLGNASRALRASGLLYLRDGVPDQEWAVQPTEPRPAHNTFVHPESTQRITVASTAMVEPLLEDNLRQLLLQHDLQVVTMRTVPGGRVFPMERVTVACKGG